MSKLTKIFRIKDLRRKIFFIVALLVVARLLAAIPIPGVDAAQLQNFFDNNQIFGLLNTSTGGGLDTFSLIMLGMGPYITASIIMQLLTMIFPSLEQMYKYDGEAGRQRFNQYSRILTVPLAMIQGYAFITLLIKKGVIGTFTVTGWMNVLIIIAAGSLFLMWLGELISEKNIGNGVSLLIFAGIVARLPLEIERALTSYTSDQLLTYAVFVLIALVVVAGVVYLTEAQRNIPINYAKRIRGSRMLGGVSTYLPMRVNNAGVMPIIFALALLLFPGLLGSFMASHAGWVGHVGRIITGIVQNQWIYSAAYFVLVVVFTYFYTAVTFDPKSISENIQKQGGYIPGIRPGEPTAQFLVHLLNRVTLVGAVFLGLIAILPQIVRGATGVTSFTVGGTSVLIVVSVALETMKALDGQLSMYEY